MGTEAIGGTWESEASDDELLLARDGAAVVVAALLLVEALEATSALAVKARDVMAAVLGAVSAVSR